MQNDAVQTETQSGAPAPETGAVPSLPLFADIGLAVPRVVLPRPDLDMEKWCVIACDQYTSEPAYWSRVQEFVGGEPSMLHLIYPEVYLPTTVMSDYVAGINNQMRQYASQGVFQEHEPGFVLVDRATPSAESRKGLVVALDLELYDFSAKSTSLIRATEKTIEDRLPPRIAVREKALVESPHILVLIDDPERTVIEPLYERRAELKQLYGCQLMEGSGRLNGYHVTARADLEATATALRRLAEKERFQGRYNPGGDDAVILFPVGDGNHSLATAKRCWETLKSQDASMDHPARYALVELMNIHDEGLDFHPIYRLVERIDVDEALADMEQSLRQQGYEVHFEEGASLTPSTDAAVHKFQMLSKSRSGVYTVSGVTNVLEVKTLDNWLNEYLKGHPSCVLDYVHEAYTIQGKAQESDDVLGFLLPSMDKNDLVKTVVKEGMLPRKTFSMGHAPEKRFYCECRYVLPQ